ELFVKARQRVIVDVASGRKTLNQLDCPETGKGLVTPDIRHYPVDPCHQEYLMAMGVSSSLVVPILHQNQLWGLLVSHHRQPRQFDERELQIVQLLVDQVSIAIAQSELLQRARLQAENEGKINQISSILHSPLALRQIRQAVLEEAVKALQASGGRLYIMPESTGKTARFYTTGDQPTITSLEETDLWQHLLNSFGRTDPSEIEFNSGKLMSESYQLLDSINFPEKGSAACPVYKVSELEQEPLLKSVISAFSTTAICSLIIVPLQYHQQCVGCLTLFRNEVETETLWAGRRNQDTRNLRPRTSFQAWREVTRGQAQKWQPEETSLAKAIGIHLYMAVMQRRIEDMLKHQASHDRLTGLPNRLLLDDRLSLALAHSHSQGKVLAVIFLDLDGFKTVNDTLGHAAGDLLLRSVAQRLKSCLRPQDLLARWGGDEFTFLLSSVNCAEEAIEFATEILNTLNTPLQFDGREQHIKASLGIALAPYDGEDAETLLKNADAAMYLAKQRGRNNYQFYTQAIGSKVQERLTIENSLYKALEREEFQLHYQAQIDSETGEIVGMEALIRWQTRDSGLIPPNLFIPLAEEMGLITGIGEWVLKRACSQNRAWQSMGLPPIRVAVNLSARQFQQKNLLKTIAQILKSTKLEPHYLELEITESIAMEDVNLTISILKQLRSLGIQIAIDDFGTGYSCLSSLKHLPLDKLKIDQSFIRELSADSEDAAIVTAILALGHGLNLEVIAEGVETQSQSAILRSLNCDVMQGYFFSRPIPAQDATNLLKKLG
ncbi:MAG: EAL domain-containing protein, partial [Coleofasciculaceae cyanobacterium]